MDVVKMIDHLLVDRGMRREDLAKRLQMSSASLSKRIARGNFRVEFLEHIAQVCDAELVVRFEDKEDDRHD